MMMNRSVRRPNSRFAVVVLSAVALSSAAGTARADAASEAEKDKTIRQLERRVELLEKRLAAVEQATTKPGGEAQPASADPLAAPRSQVDAQIAKARQRMAKDRKKYNVDELAEAEDLYQVANRQWRSPEGRESLKKMVEKYPDVNRTGCALLYLGQQSRGDEKVKYLTDAFEKYGDCYYGNGVQVGPFARFMLGAYMKDMGKPDEAQKLFDHVLKNNPDAVDHGQRSLAKVVKQVMTATTQPTE
jgi:TolA-binding protein